MWRFPPAANWVAAAPTPREGASTVDPLTLAVGVGTAVAGIGTGLRLRQRLRRAETAAADLRRDLAAERYAANHDSLTGLPNRRAFYRLGDQLVERAPGSPIACVVIDLNSFKQVNDTLGHAAGDEVLVTVARRLAGYADGNLVARLGGDEFAGLFTSPGTDCALLYPVADDLAELLARPMPVAERDLRVTASVGAAAVGAGGLATALRHADRAMYRAKATGARAACYHPGLDDPHAGRDPHLGSDAYLGHDPRVGRPVHTREPAVVGTGARVRSHAGPPSRAATGLHHTGAHTGTGAHAGAHALAGRSHVATPRPQLATARTAVSLPDHPRDGHMPSPLPPSRPTPPTRT